jgi:sugar (pentulose or hexulose) kinase
VQSKNNLLNQIIANILGINVEAGPILATVVGSIMIQAYTTGTVGSLKETDSPLKLMN